MRLSLHRRIGERKEVGYGERAGEITAELAVHFEQGRDYRRAVSYLRRAAEHAMQRCGYREAVGLFTKGVELLKTLPDTPERGQQELAMHLLLGASLSVIKGYAAQEAESVYARALELCRQMEESPQFFWVLLGLCNVHLLRGRLRSAYEVGEKLFSLAQKEQDQELLLWAHAALGIPVCHLGEWTGARSHLEQGIAFYEPHKHAPIIGVACLSYLASVLAGLGYVDQAVKRIDEALALAEEQQNPYSLVYALSHAALLHHFRQENEIAQTRAEAAITLATDYGLTHWLAVGTVARGAALAGQGHGEKGITLMRQGLVAFRATGAETACSRFLALLAEGYSRAGWPEEGLSVLAEAFAVAQRIGERNCEAELYRLKGELLLKKLEARSQKPTPDTLHPPPWERRRSVF